MSKHKKIIGKLFANDLVSVQPMAQPLGNIFYTSIKYYSLFKKEDVLVYKEQLNLLIAKNTINDVLINKAEIQKSSATKRFFGGEAKVHLKQIRTLLETQKIIDN